MINVVVLVGGMRKRWINDEIVWIIKLIKDTVKPKSFVGKPISFKFVWEGFVFDINGNDEEEGAGFEWDTVRPGNDNAWSVTSVEVIIDEAFIGWVFAAKERLPIIRKQLLIKHSSMKVYLSLKWKHRQQQSYDASVNNDKWL